MLKHVPLFCNSLCENTKNLCLNNMIMLKSIAFATDNWYNAKYKGSKERG